MNRIQRHMLRSIAAGAVFLGGVAGVQAGEHEHHHGAASTQASAGPAAAPYLLDTDPVSGVALGEKPIVYDYNGRELRFHDEGTLDAFKADPAKYLPKLDKLMIERLLPSYPLDTCVVSGDKLGGDMGKPVDKIYRNRLVRFCCPECIRDFEKNPARFLAKIDAAAKAKTGNAAAK